MFQGFLEFLSKVIIKMDYMKIIFRYKIRLNGDIDIMEKCKIFGRRFEFEKKIFRCSIGFYQMLGK